MTSTPNPFESPVATAEEAAVLQFEASRDQQVLRRCSNGLIWSGHSLRVVTIATMAMGAVAVFIDGNSLLRMVLLMGFIAVDLGAYVVLCIALVRCTGAPPKSATRLMPLGCIAAAGCHWALVIGVMVSVWSGVDPSRFSGVNSIGNLMLLIQAAFLISYVWSTAEHYRLAGAKKRVVRSVAIVGGSVFIGYLTFDAASAFGSSTLIRVMILGCLIGAFLGALMFANAMRHLGAALRSTLENDCDNERMSTVVPELG